MVEQRDNQITSVSFWWRKYGIDVSSFFIEGFEACKESRLRLLHFKILHNIYPTNILLYKMKIKNSSLCENCQKTDFIEHFFFHCNKLQGYWKHVSNTIFIKTEVRIDINETIALFGIDKTNSHIKTNSKKRTKINHILLVAKMCISKARYGKCPNAKLLFETEMHLRERSFQ